MCTLLTTSGCARAFVQVVRHHPIAVILPGFQAISSDLCAAGHACMNVALHVHAFEGK